MTYGNPNLLFFNGYQYFDYSSTSEASASLDTRTIAVELLSSTDCWVRIGEQGETPTAAAVGTEKTRSYSFKLKADVAMLVPVPVGTTSNPIKLAVIRDTADGTLEVYERRA